MSVCSVCDIGSVALANLSWTGKQFSKELRENEYELKTRNLAVVAATEITRQVLVSIKRPSSAPLPAPNPVVKV